MSEETGSETEDYISVIVTNTKAVLDIVDVIREKWLAVIENDRDYSDAIAGAEAMKTEVITGSYPQIISLLLSPPPAAEEPAEIEGTTMADRLERTDGQPTRAGRGSG